MRRRLFIILFLTAFLFPQKDLIQEICDKQERIKERLSGYRQKIVTEVLTYDQNEKLIDKEIRKRSLYWNGKEWVEEGGEKEEKKGHITPLECRYRYYYNYTIEENDKYWIIKAKLKEKFRKADAEEGSYYVSKESGYLEKEEVYLTKLSPLLKEMRIELKYGKIDKDVYAPFWMRVVVKTKRFFGISRKVIMTSQFSYEKRAEESG